MLTATFIRTIEKALTSKLRKPTHIRRIQPLSGGSINTTCRLDCGMVSYFLKVNDAFRFPDMFAKEAEGLNRLRKAGNLRIPEVILEGSEEEQGYLILEFFAPGNRKPSFWKDLANGLAALHRVTSAQFGYDENNYIGSLEQQNHKSDTWINFFIKQRLEVQFELAASKGYFDQSDRVLFEKFCDRIEHLFPVEPPALLHGDLWSGNLILTPHGDPVVIDPAVYFGHREMDLAMTVLFGGFDDEFYDHYQEIFPLAPGFEERVDICNLYPVLVHANLFGGEYVGQVKKVVKCYI